MHEKNGYKNKIENRNEINKNRFLKKGGNYKLISTWNGKKKKNTSIKLLKSDPCSRSIQKELKTI